MLRLVLPLRYCALVQAIGAAPTAVLRMADELTALVGAAGFDGGEFDFESIESEMTSNSPDPSLKFDFGAAHVAMIKQVSKTLKASQQSTIYAICSPAKTAVT
mgnify:CR=1 FL=1